MNTTSTVVTGLQPQTTYSFRVKAINSLYSSSYSNVAQATTEAFEPPRSLVAAPKSISEIDLTWTDASNGEAGFIVELRLAPGGWMVADTVGENVNICTVGGLQPETQYEFRVMTFDGAVHSAYSNIASATTLPFPAPSNLTATATTCTDIRLDWTDNTTGESAFIVEQLVGASSWMPVDTLPANTASCVIGGLQPSRLYSFRIAAVNGPAYSKYSNTADATTLPFLAPTNLRATSVGSSGAELEWNDNTPFETGYVLESYAPPGMWTPLMTLAANVTAYAVTGLAPSTDYSFRVKAVRGSVASDYSNTLALKTKKFLPAPTNFQATVKSLSEAQLTWNDNSTQETGYEIEQRSPAGAWTLVNTTSADVNAYVRSSLTPDSTYIFRIRAVAIEAASEWSEAKTVVMAYKPDAPLSLTATAIDYRSIRLTWRRGSANTKSYEIERRISMDAWTFLRSAGAGDTMTVDDGLASATIYTYRVRALNAAGASGWSNETSATTLSVPAPGTPFGIMAVATGPASIRLTWLIPEPPVEAGFEVEESRTGDADDFAPVKPDASAGARLYDRRGLLPETRYYYRIRAFNAGGRSAYSKIVDATTFKEIPLPPLAPYNLSATAIDLTLIRLSWEIADTTYVENFELERSLTGIAGDFTPVQPGPAGADRSFTDGGLMENTLYFYRIRATNKFGPSAWTDTVSARTQVRTIPPALLAAMDRKDSLIALLEALLPAGDAHMAALRSLLGDHELGLDEQSARELIANWKKNGVPDAIKSTDAMNRYALFEGTVLDLSGAAVALELARQATLAPAVAVKDLAALALAWKGERPIAPPDMQPWLDAAMTTLAHSLFDGARTLNALAGIDHGIELGRFYTEVLTRNGDVTAISPPLLPLFAPYYKERACARVFLPAVQPSIAAFAGKADRLEIGGTIDSALAKVERITDGIKADIASFTSAFSSFSSTCTALDASYSLSTAAGPALPIFFRRLALGKDGYLAPLGRTIENAAIPATRGQYLGSLTSGLPAYLTRTGQAAFDPGSVAGFTRTNPPDLLPSFSKHEEATTSDPAFSSDRTLLRAIRDLVLATDTAGIAARLADIHAGGLSVIAAIDRLQRPLTAIDPASVLADAPFAAVYYPAVGQAQRAKSIRAALLVSLLDFRLDPISVRQAAISAEIDTVLAMIDRAQLSLADARAVAGLRLAVPAPVLDSAALEAIPPTGSCRLAFFIRNAGGAPISSSTLRITPLTPGVALSGSGDISGVAIPAGAVSSHTVNCTVPAGLDRATFAVEMSIDAGATFVDLCYLTIPPPVATAVDRPESLPRTIMLEQNYPNPFNLATTIRYSLPSEMHVKLRVYDVLGRPITVLVDAFEHAGNHGVRFDAQHLPSGVYLYRLETGGQMLTRLMTQAR